MALLDAQKLFKTIGARTLLGSVDLVIEEGERVGLVGPNGCGKSTLARILAGIDAADGGEVHKRRGARVLYLAQEPAFEPGETALEAVLSGLDAWRDARARHAEASEALGRGDGDEAALLAELERAAHDVERLGGWERDHEARAYLDHLGIERHDALAAQMSGGERRRVALARLLVARPDLAILDEPTNHLDVESIEWLEKHLTTSFPGAVLLVTHDRWFLNQVVTRTLELERGALTSYDGGWEEYLEGKLERAALAERAEANRQNILRRELAWMRRTPAARTGKQKARIQRAEAVIAESGPARERGVELRMESTRMGRTVLDLDRLRLEVGGRVLVRELTLSMTAGERIGIVGPNGCGKTTLLRAILGTLEPAGGEVRRGANTKIAYLDQLRSGLDEDASVAENVAPSSRWVDWAGRRMELVSYLERMLFDAEQQRQPVRALSGGERARVLVARMLLESANLLILDEPTNDLDAPTLGALEEMLVEFPGSALVVTHDRWFLERVATGILAFEGDGVVRKWEGSYSTWRALAASPKDAAPAATKTAPAAAPAAASPRASSPPPKKKGLSFKEARELEGIMDEIDLAEGEVTRLEAELSDPGVYATRGAEVPALVEALERARAHRDERMARWEALEARKAEAGS